MRIAITLALTIVVSIAWGQKKRIIPVDIETATGGYFGPKPIIVKLDPFSRIPDQDIPIDRNFYMRVYFSPTAIIPDAAWLVDQIGDEEPDAANSSAQLLVVGPFGEFPDTAYEVKEDSFLQDFLAIDILITPLKPNKRYNIVLRKDLPEKERDAYVTIMDKIYNQAPDAAITAFYNADPDIQADQGRTSIENIRLFYDQKNIEKIYQKYPANIAAAHKEIKDVMTNDNLIKPATGTGTIRVFRYFSLSDFTLFTDKSTLEASAPLSLVADAGLVVVGMQKGFTQVTPFVGINYTFRPLDSDIPFRRIGLKWYQRFSVNAAITLTSLAKDNYRGNLFGDNNILVGGGFKFSHAISIVGGVVIFNKLDPNPVVDSKSAAVAPYAGISINLKIRDALGDIAKVFTYGK